MSRATSTQVLALSSMVLWLITTTWSPSVTAQPAKSPEPHASGGAPVSKPEDEKAKIVEFDGFMARAFTSMPDLSLDIVDVDENSPELNFSPNVALNIGLGLSYAGLGAALSTRVPDSTDDQAQYGKTDYYDLQIYYYARRFGLDAYYQVYEGFYFEDPAAAGPGCTRGDSCSLMPDLQMGTIGVNAYYVHSEEYSFPAAFTQSERQLQSGGSLLAMVSGSHITVDNGGEPIIPEQHAPAYGDEAGLVAGTFTSVTLSPGYAYTFVWSDYFLTPVIFVGGGVQHRSSDLGTEVREDFAFALDVNLKLATGYNGESFIGGLTAVGDSMGVALDKVAMTVMVMSVELFFGLKI